MEVTSEWRQIWLQRGIAALIGAVLFLVFLRLYTLHNAQPMHYHPDEQGKGEQVYYDERNWNHPTLLLDSAAWAVNVFNVDMDVEKIVQTGRCVSAAFAAACVVTLACIGYIEAGLLGM